GGVGVLLRCRDGAVRRVERHMVAAKDLPLERGNIRAHGGKHGLCVIGLLDQVLDLLRNGATGVDRILLHLGIALGGAPHRESDAALAEFCRPAGRFPALFPNTRVGLGGSLLVSVIVCFLIIYRLLMPLTTPKNALNLVVLDFSSLSRRQICNPQSAVGAERSWSGRLNR